VTATAEKNPIGLTLNVKSTLVECGRNACMIAAPQVEVFHEAFAKGHEWGNWGWYNLQKLQEAADQALWLLGGSGITISAAGFQSFRNEFLFPSETKPFNWILKQRTLEGNLVSLFEGKDANECPFEWNERNQLYILAKWGTRVMHLACKGIVGLVPTAPGQCQAHTWKGTDVQFPLDPSPIARSRIIVPSSPRILVQQ
jgi:hypothetical protein